MSKHEIEVEGMPEGWEPVAYRKPVFGEYYFYNDDIVQGKTGCGQFLIVKKKQTRRITFEETDCNNVCDLEEGVKWTFFDDKYWREVKETEEPKLCLSVKECEEMVYNDYSIPVDLSVKIHNFLSAINKTS